MNSTEFKEQKQRGRVTTVGQIEAAGNLSTDESSLVSGKTFI